MNQLETDIKTLLQTLFTESDVKVYRWEEYPIRPDSRVSKAAILIRFLRFQLSNHDGAMNRQPIRQDGSFEFELRYFAKSLDDLDSQGNAAIGIYSTIDTVRQTFSNWLPDPASMPSGFSRTAIGFYPTRSEAAGRSESAWDWGESWRLPVIHLAPVKRD